MRVTLTIIRNPHPKTYYRFQLVNITWINTVQVICLNIVLCNIFLKFLHEKKRDIFITK